jgi:hypothetical protein
MVAVDDIGALAALAFEHPGKWKDRTFSLAGYELSMQQIEAVQSEYPATHTFDRCGALGICIPAMVLLM